jgi:hypothetical protein
VTGWGNRVTGRVTGDRWVTGWGNRVTGGDRRAFVRADERMFSELLCERTSGCSVSFCASGLRKLHPFCSDPRRTRDEDERPASAADLQQLRDEYERPASAADLQQLRDEYERPARNAGRLSEGGMGGEGEGLFNWITDAWERDRRGPLIPCIPLLNSRSCAFLTALPLIQKNRKKA